MIHCVAFQACFTFRHSVGVIGGKPNHAYYFIGYYGKYLIGKIKMYLSEILLQPLIVSLVNKSYGQPRMLFLQIAATF